MGFPLLKTGTGFSLAAGFVLNQQGSSIKVNVVR